MLNSKSNLKRTDIIYQYKDLKKFFLCFFNNHLWNYSVLEEKNFYFSRLIKRKIQYISNKLNLEDYIFKYLFILISPLILIFSYVYACIFLSRFALKNKISNEKFQKIKKILIKNDYIIIKHLPSNQSLKNINGKFIDQQCEYIYEPFLKKRYVPLYKNIFFYENKFDVLLIENLIIQKNLLSIFFKVIFAMIFNLLKIILMLVIDKRYFNKDAIIDLNNSLLFKRYLEIEIYKIIFSNLNKLSLNQTKLIYISENQFWEKILLYENKSITSYAIFLNKNRYWDLKYCHTLNDNSLDKNLLPSNIISLYNEDILEYKLFNKYSNFHQINFKNIKPTKTNKTDIKNIIIYGDYIKSNSQKLINEVELNIRKFKKRYNVYFKKHPNESYHINLPSFINNIHDEVILKKKHIAIVIDTSSVGFDCIINNNIVITILSDNSINMSPLYNLGNHQFLYCSSLENFDYDQLNFFKNFELDFSYLTNNKKNFNQLFFEK